MSNEVDPVTQLVEALQASYSPDKQMRDAGTCPGVPLCRSFLGVG